ncbi:malate dehydrogenase, mitochondrial-like [Salvia miltiorrhiza]|uniref:malate dehydrogenase, mitochondrial-like n=1 Tax=Salvia miltiorrhiza TaxID=226208 RepID=UPI0025AC6654|nr:malate dehydrogenase, mitochondrial-like [Salvia miltiorrhiza]
MTAAMLRSLLRRSTSSAASSYCFSSRRFSSGAAPERKVAILGAAGGIGQPLSLLMKLNPLVSRLALYDIAGTPGVAADVSHVNTRSEVKGFAGEDQLGQALEGSDIVIIPAGVPRKPGMTRDDLFAINAGIVKSLCEAIAKYCPNALVNMISNPVNSTVPIAAEVFKNHGVYDERKLFGVTTLDVVRAKTFYAGKANVNVADVNVPVIGGHAGITILPLFSQATPKANLSDDDIKALTKRTQDGGTEVVEAKAGKGSATLSMAYAGALFADACLKGLNGVPDVVECTFVQSTVTELPFFASKVKLGKNGVEEVLGFGPLSDYEQQGLEALKKELKSSIEKGIAWHAKSKNPTIQSVYEPIKPIFRPLSPHLPIYKPQTSSTVSITNRVSAVILTTVPLTYAFLTLKMGPICLANESVYQAMYYSSKLGPIALQITALATAYHLVHGLYDLYQLFRP